MLLLLISGYCDGPIFGSNVDSLNYEQSKNLGKRNYQNIMEFFEAIGWLGNVVLSIGVIPQVWKTFRTHDVSSFSWSFLLMWCLGVILTFIYIAHDNFVEGNFQWPLWLNYLVNILGTVYLVWAKIKYSTKEQNKTTTQA